MAFDVVVPALIAQTQDGAIDFATTRRYAVRAAETWVDYFILSGSTARGDLLDPADRAAILDLWLEITEPKRLLTCCWVPEDIRHAIDRSVVPMAVLRNPDHASAVAFLAQLPPQSTIYSHPMFGGQVFDSKLADEARIRDVLPAGGKIAKITTAQVHDLHAAAGDEFRLWDGSSRRIAASLAAGAAGVVATPLSVFGDDFPSKDLDGIQAAVNAVQSTLDALPTRATRSDMLMQRVSELFQAT
ncbi:hypothetical protein GZH49_36315 [Nocardia terpenica]|uniref:hypothetical protein n=1 Tax=Nocardia terpenica TaxID=455432 RepID=UPI002FE2AC88